MRCTTDITIHFQLNIGFLKGRGLGKTHLSSDSSANKNRKVARLFWRGQHAIYAKSANIMMQKVFQYSAQRVWQTKLIKMIRNLNQDKILRL